jgi:hypothetical protein
MRFIDFSLMMLPLGGVAGECVGCGMRKLLSWQVCQGEDWGNVCAECGLGILLQQLRIKLQGRFRAAALFNALRDCDVPGKEAELMIEDFERAELIVAKPGGFFVLRDPSVNGGRKRVSAEEILLRCIRLSGELEGGRL